MNNTDQKLAFLGIAAKAGKVASGGFQVEEAIPQHKAFFVMIAEDASDNTKKKFSDKCTYYHIPFVYAGTMDLLGNLIGKENRTVVAITDEGFSAQFKKRFGVGKMEA